MRVMHTVFRGRRSVGLVGVGLVMLQAMSASAAQVAAADTTDGTPEPVLSGAVPAPARRSTRLPTIGLAADAGVPDGLMGALVVRPVSVLRLHIGAGANSSSPGVRAGVTVLPFGSGPSLSLEAGHYMAGEANGLVRLAFGGIGRFASYVGRVGYSFVNAHAGLDFGSRDLTFYVHGGMTFMRATLQDVQIPPEMSTRADRPSTMITFREDPVLRMFTPSVKLGLIFYLQ